MYVDSLTKVFKSWMSSDKSNFTDVANEAKSAVLATLLSSVVMLVLMLLFGEYLFNNVLVKVVPAIKPVTSIWQLLGLMIVLKMLF